MAVINNYNRTPWAKLSADGEWRIFRQLFHNKISGAAVWFTGEEIHQMKEETYQRPPSKTICVICDSPLNEDGVCRFDCARRLKGRQ